MATGYKISFRLADMKPSTLSITTLIVGFVQSESTQFDVGSSSDEGTLSFRIEAVFEDEERASEIDETFKLKALTDHLVNLSIEKTTID